MLDTGEVDGVVFATEVAFSTLVVGGEVARRDNIYHDRGFGGL